MAEMQYPEFRQKLIQLVREVVTQLPELRPNVELLAKNLADKEKMEISRHCFMGLAIGSQYKIYKTS